MNLMASEALADWIKTKVSCGQYVNSEHIVRDLTCRGISIPRLEEALINGELLETHTHPSRGPCYLILRRDDEGPLHIMCAKQEPDVLILLYACRPQMPTWVSETKRSEGSRQMDDNLTKCFFCNSRIEPIKMGNFNFRWEGGLYVIKNVPAGLCVQCGEKYVSAQVSRRIVSKIEQEEAVALDKVLVFDYER